MAPALRPELNHEHPVVAWTGIAAVLGAIILILWARFEVHGTHDLKSTLAADEPKPPAVRPKASPPADNGGRNEELEDAVATGRWAAGFSP